ncbi:TonB-dependent siderophore receptor [Nitrospirillum sp. BR 11163]|uniref:TonB-dependent siderophore receptor n=1 Tax=Nitrospirillum sp. BR 11163 TaxID=3104323 RepID=UPI002AFEB123|nr:TonB-dependent siderophore receptor [Nitrospirillum sp. BR 11163]MEA1671984.1 TonB-dependent siderophore receptor [Nitrospirillum sp. BR 11163]
MTGRSSFRFFCAASAAYLMFMPVARAADDQAPATGDSLEEITVTAQKQQYRGDVPAQAMPQSLQVISSELLSDIGATRLDTALDMAAGMARQNNFGGMWDSYAVRGFSGDENFPSGYLVNGFNASRGFGGPRDASNIDHIEILKGPNSALFGRGEPGGTVNILTKKPKFDPQGSMTLTAGNYADKRVEGDVTGPWTDNLAVRLNGAYEDGHSFRDTVRTTKYTLTPSAFLRLNDQMSLSYEMEDVHQEMPFDRGVVAVNGVLGKIPANRFLGEPADDKMKIDGLSHQLQFEDNFAKDWSLLVGLSYRDTAMKGYSDEAELTASRQKLYVDGQTLSRQRRYRDYETGDLVGRAEVSGKFDTGIFTNHVLVGADWDRFSFDQLQNRFRPTLANPNGINIYNPVYSTTLKTVGSFVNSLEIDNSGGVYFQDQIDLTGHWKLRVGARYDDYSQDIYNRLTGTWTRLSDTATSPQAGLVYEVSDMLSLYASYGRGFRPNTGTDAKGGGFKPEETESYEVGAKLATTDEKLTGTLALFSMTKNNIMTADPVNAGFSLAIGEAESKGVEVDVTGTLPGDFKLWFSYAYTDAEVAKDFLDPNFGLAIHKGDRLINIPKHSGSLLLTRDFQVGEGVVTVGGGVNYVGSRLGETGASFTLPDYTLTRLIASYAPNRNWKISGEISNLFDETYYSASYSRLWVTPGTPRTYRVHASYRF